MEEELTATVLSRKPRAVRIQEVCRFEEDRVLEAPVTDGANSG